MIEKLHGKEEKMAYVGYTISFVMLLCGGWLLLQCFDCVCYEEKKLHRVCVFGKLTFAIGLLAVLSHPVFALLCFFCFYPKSERQEINGKVLALQVAVTVTAAIVGGAVFKTDRSYLLLFGISIAAVVFAVAEFGIRSVLLKNKQLYRQMEHTALNELKVKNLNREISMRSQMAEKNARLEEREHIARNIHNVVGHTITSALVSLQAYEVLKEAEPARAEGKLAATSERMHLALEEIRRAVRVLDAETEDMELRDFCSLLATEADKFSMDTEISVSHNFTDIPDGSVTVEKRTCEFLHSVLTECLNNGIRHGNATAFFAVLTYDTAHIRLAVSDNGTGFAGKSLQEQTRCLEQGYGLRKMKAYVQEHGGSFVTDGDSGFKVQVELPLLTQEERTGGQ